MAIYLQEQGNRILKQVDIARLIKLESDKVLDRVKLNYSVTFILLQVDEFTFMEVPEDKYLNKPSKYINYKSLGKVYYDRGVKSN